MAHFRLPAFSNDFVIALSFGTGTALLVAALTQELEMKEAP
jgi:hypothetical protein